MPIVLAIDQGTSGTKAIVVDSDGGVIASAEVPIRPAYLAGGGVEQDPEELYSSVVAAGKQAIETAGRPVDVIALANQGETVLAWDKQTGRALTAAIGWQDRRSESIIGSLAHAQEWVAERTGLVLDPYFSAPKMAWLRANRTSDGVVTTTDSWLVHRLCGEFVSDASTASRSLLVDLDTVQWDRELLELFGLHDEVLPAIVDSDATIGLTTAFGRDLPLAGLLVDQQAALLAQGCLTAGMAKATFGTGAFVLANTAGRAVRSHDGLSSSVAWRLRGTTTYCLDGQVYTAASAIRWLIDIGLINRVDEIDQLEGPMDRAVLCVPALAGLGAPWWRPDATASFTGLTLSTRREDLVLAVMYGIAAQLADVTELMAAEVTGDSARLRVDGGLVRCAALMQATADLLQMPVDVYPHLHATALGVAAAARLACDSQLSVREAVSSWTAAQTFVPSWSAAQAGEYLGRWRAAASANLGPRAEVPS